MGWYGVYMVVMVPWSPGTLVPWSPGVLVGYLSFQNELEKKMCLVGKNWYGFGLMKSVNFGLCEYCLVIW